MGVFTPGLSPKFDYENENEDEDEDEQSEYENYETNPIVIFRSADEYRGLSRFHDTSRKKRSQITGGRKPEDGRRKLAGGTTVLPGIRHPLSKHYWLNPPPTPGNFTPLS
jgi:hypothetical protein